MRLPLGRQELFLVSDLDLIQHVLLDQALFTKHGGIFELLRPLLGDGLLNNPDLGSWARSRHIFLPAFAKDKVATYAQGVHDEVLRTLEMLAISAKGGEPVEMLEPLTHLALRVAVRALFSGDCGEDDFALVDRAVRSGQEQVRQQLTNPLSLPAHWPTPLNLRVNRAMQALDALIERLVSGRRASTKRYDDLLDCALHGTSAEGRHLSAKELRDELVTMLVTAHESTGNAIAWSLKLISEHPEFADKLAGDAARAIAEDPAPERLALLPTARAVFSEAMRLYPPIWMYTRTASQAVDLGGRRIPQGATVVVSPYVVHRDPNVWDDPGAFRPDRFEGNRPAKAMHSCAYLPFGAGPRKCIGIAFGLLEASITLGLACRRFRFALASPKVEPLAQVTLSPRALSLYVTPRGPESRSANGTSRFQHSAPFGTQA